MLKVAIVGGSGYTGLELMRILASHPETELVAVTSRQYKDKRVADIFPALAGFYDGLVFSDPEDMASLKADAAFSALPHGASQQVVESLTRTCEKVIDLSADFRLHDAAVYASWYGEHSCTQLLGDAVYGLPELHREEIKKASLVANPGCYPTSAILALAPLAKAGLLEPGSVVFDSKSGVSGAGRSASVETSFVELNGAFKAYKIGSHRHISEMEQELSLMAGTTHTITFTPHLLPVSRGILTTAYAATKKGLSCAGLHELYGEFYSNEPFVRVMAESRFPDICQVRGSNFCDLGVYADEKRARVVVVSVIDNLVKGASGQAVQNMNIAFGMKEDTALKTPALSI